MKAIIAVSSRRKLPGEKLLFDEGGDPRGIFRSTRLQIDRALL
jgi:hypothetical protein